MNIDRDEIFLPFRIITVSNITETFSGSARILTDFYRACNFEEDVFQGETFDLLHQENVRRLRLVFDHFSFGYES